MDLSKILSLLIGYRITGHVTRGAVRDELDGVASHPTIHFVSLTPVIETMKISIAAAFLASTASAFVGPSVTVRPSTAIGPVIADGVEFDTVAREWRCKWSPDEDKASLVEAQKALDEILGDVKAIDGVKSVERIVCGGCLDFKVITSLDAEKYGTWEEADFKPEADFIAKLEGIDGISLVETQTFTKMPM
uniref:Uncharacterized protein n=1 Tax=Entomoneis paludosa TaxID=265537 RepID=A0A7S2Y2C1_9STRA|mmetsp:Transcript_1148/g.2530  ORF Transcript_1148/g.2530 Transcript_1148/m.2530 type:complete len:191 (+) Transcript_1148:172-744(+)